MAKKKEPKPAGLTPADVRDDRPLTRAEVEWDDSGLISRKSAGKQPRDLRRRPKM